MNSLLGTLCTSLWGYLLDFISPPDYVSLLGTCRSLRTYLLHTPTLANHHVCELNIRRMLHAVFVAKKCVLVHGPGGSGKSFALQCLIEEARARQIKIGVTGTTGVSSINLPTGSTIHSFSGLGLAKMSLDDLKQSVTKTQRGADRYQQLKPHVLELLVIDEISMLTASLLEKLNWLCQFVRNNFTQAFGGLQVVFCGDFLQLPPIGSRFVFTSLVWPTINLYCVPFLTSFRQKDDLRYAQLLIRLRKGQQTEHDLKALKRRVTTNIPEQMVQNVGIHVVPPILYSRHRQVNVLNQDRLNQLPGPVTNLAAEDNYYISEKQYDPVTKSYTTQLTECHAPPMSELSETLMTSINSKQPQVLQIKPNAQYILTQNFKNLHLVNGSICMSRIDPTGQIHFWFSSINKTYKASQFKVTQTYLVDKRKRMFLSRRQYCFRLGYAVTIHASQGMTLDQAVVDSGDSIFACAQAYVACSRVKTLQGLFLLDFSPSSLKIHKDALNYVTQLEDNKKYEKYPLFIDYMMDEKEHPEYFSAQNEAQPMLFQRGYEYGQNGTTSASSTSSHSSSSASSASSSSASISSSSAIGSGVQPVDANQVAQLSAPLFEAEETKNTQSVKKLRRVIPAFVKKRKQDYLDALQQMSEPKTESKVEQETKSKVLQTTKGTCPVGLLRKKTYKPKKVQATNNQDATENVITDATEDVIDLTQN